MRPLEFESATGAQARQVLDGKPRADGQEWSARRAAVDEHETPHPATMQWMDELPAKVQPLWLALSFPRIVNTIRSLWDKPVRCSSYLIDLLIVRRMDRHGFPLAIANEISELTAYCASLHQVEPPWAEAR